MISKRSLQKLKDIPIDVKIVETFMKITYEIYSMNYFRISSEHFQKIFSDFCNDFLGKVPGKQEYIELVRRIKMNGILTTEDNKFYYALFKNNSFEFYIYDNILDDDYIFGNFTEEDIIVSFYKIAHEDFPEDKIFFNVKDSKVISKSKDGILIGFDFFIIFSNFTTKMERLCNPKKFLNVCKDLSGRTFKYNLEGVIRRMTVIKTPDSFDSSFIFNFLF